MKIFIALSTIGKTAEEVLKEEDAVFETLRDKHDEVELTNASIMFAQTKSKDFVTNLKTLIKKLFDADVAVFAKGWEKEKEFQIGHIICKKYGIKTIEL